MQGSASALLALLAAVAVSPGVSVSRIHASQLRAQMQRQLTSAGNASVGIRPVNTTLSQLQAQMQKQLRPAGVASVVAKPVMSIHGSAPVPRVRSSQLQAQTRKQRRAAGNASVGIKPVKSTPGFPNPKKQTFLVTGAGDPDINGCYAHVFTESDPPSMMYWKQSTHESFLNFGPAHQCSVDAKQKGKKDAYYEVCDPERVGWFLSKLKCIEEGCTVDVYFMKASATSGTIENPAKGPWECRPEIRKRWPGQKYGDCIKPIPKVEMVACDPLEDQPKFGHKSGALGRPLVAALLLAAAVTLGGVA